MRKKIISFVIIACIIFVGITVKTYGVSGNITKEELADPNTEPNKTNITKKILDATGRQDQFSPNEVDKIVVYYGNVITGNTQDAIISLRLGPKNTVVTAYTPDGEVYKYVDELGNYLGVTNIDFVPVKDLGKDIVVVNEYANQKIGSFENSDFIRVYQYDGNDFVPVLEVPNNISAYWNLAWDSNTSTKEVPNQWVNVTQKGDYKWEKSENPILNTVSMQSSSESNDKEAKNIPNEETFNTLKERVVSQKYYWSNEWKKLILSEKIDNSTGEKVGVIEDLSASPYSLISGSVEKYRIIKKDGSEDIVDKSSLSDVPGAVSYEVFKSF